MLERLHQIAGLVGTMSRARLIAPLRPDRYVRMAAAVRRAGMNARRGSRSPPSDVLTGLG
jgi:hypothetical protein